MPPFDDTHTPDDASASSPTLRLVEPCASHPSPDSASGVLDLVRAQLKREISRDPLLGNPAHLDWVDAPDGYTYVSCKHLPEDTATLERWRHASQSAHYVVTFWELHPGGDRLNHYHVDGARLAAFMRTTHQRPGQLIEVRPFTPEHLA